jgi:1,2-phenylacetyl-CoA epoxidase PaaB subunit
MATGQLYEVFARRTRDESLGHVGTVNATSIDFARVYARATYDEENWIEMVVVERAAMIPVIELEPLVEFKETE